jgi:polyhydroxyalkanoate synthesis regulator phasin
MFKFRIDNVNNRINGKMMNHYQKVVDTLVKKIELKVLEGTDMMG